jgi:hypothetical protein
MPLHAAGDESVEYVADQREREEDEDAPKVGDPGIGYVVQAQEDGRRSETGIRQGEKVRRDERPEDRHRLFRGILQAPLDSFPRTDSGHVM